MNIRPQLHQLSQKHQLTFIVLFGSQARNQPQNPESDLDIAILTKNKPTTQDFFNLFSELSEAFPNQNVDLRFLNDADPLFKFNVVKDGKLLYGDPKAYQMYKHYAMKIYVDDLQKYQPFLDRLLELNQKKLEANL